MRQEPVVFQLSHATDPRRELVGDKIHANLYRRLLNTVIKPNPCQSEQHNVGETRQRDPSQEAIHQALFRPTVELQRRSEDQRDIVHAADLDHQQEAHTEWN
jgi:hypothetical protein